MTDYALDSKGVYVGTYVGGVSFQQPTLIPLEPDGKSVLFDGSSGYIDLGDAYDFAARVPFGGIVWLLPTADKGVNNWPRIISKESSDGSGRQGWCVSLNGGLWPAFSRWVNNIEDKVTSPVVLGLSADYHQLAWSYDGSEMSIWVDKQLCGVQPSTSSLVNASGSLRVGTSVWASPGDFFTGYIQALQLYNRALTQADINADWDAAVGSVLELDGQLEVYSEFSGELVVNVDWEGQTVAHADYQGNIHVEYER